MVEEKQFIESVMELSKALEREYDDNNIYLTIETILAAQNLTAACELLLGRQC